MSIPNQALQKLAREIESQANSAQREINIVKAAITSKQRDARMLELTFTEVEQLHRDTKLYEGVGKMCSAAVDKLLHGNRVTDDDW
ncbi:MAG: hypothetical protein Q9163_003254 [Psora crenata]